MIGFSTELQDGAVLRADVCIVGAGIAGIDLARYLGGLGRRVLLLESGRLEFDPHIQALAQVRCVGKPLRTHEDNGDMSLYLPPMYRGYCRIRQFGGTTKLWTGKWRIFDPLDFTKRSWIEHSGWPIGLDDLMPYYRETARDYGFGDFDAESQGGLFSEAERRLAPHGLAPHLFYWEAAPTRSGTRFLQELKRRDEVEVVLGATATEIVLHDDPRAVRAIECRSLDGRSWRVEASAFVLAAGGLEAPRLLLASNRQLVQGIGNQHGLVGRFFMDHPKHKGGVLTPGAALDRLADGLLQQPRPRFGLSIALSETAQRERALPNHVLFLRPGKRPRFGFKRRYEVKIGIEQTPNPESRVYLGSRRDALGVPELVLDWRFTRYDQAAFAALQAALTEACAAAGLGYLSFGAEPLVLDRMLDASHHMGTTRMTDDPEHGVVDRNCRVFGTDNLYVAGSAVFPTSHGYSPTYTILALARRLGEHIAAQGGGREVLHLHPLDSEPDRVPAAAGAGHA